MRRSVLALAAVLSLSAAAAAQAQTVMAPMDQAVSIDLAGTAADVVIGNPAIADVQLLNGRQMVVIGKGYGVTSLHVFDAQGRSILARQVVVSSAGDDRVTYYRGSAVSNYACTSRCEQIPAAGGGALTGGGALSTQPAPAPAPTTP